MLGFHKQVCRLKDDMQCLYSMWFGKIQGDTHKDRLEAFYKSQANEYDNFRAGFLHGRKEMLAACAARLRDATGMVWVDLGGGTAENVRMMSEFMDLSAFDKIYVVDICSSLCDVAVAKVKRMGWSNVEVVEEDACKFNPERAATLVTFSYSLSMIPPFIKVIDQALCYLEEDGILGVADFFTSAKYDNPNRQHSWMKRWFWRSVFDCDGIDLGPDRRQYLEHCLEAVFEYNGHGKIPYVPLLKPPYYIWLGKRRNFSEMNPLRFPVRAADDLEAKRPSTFPPTFLYSLSWEDPREDEKVLDIGSTDTVLTLTSGGCNTFDLLLQGAGLVVAVDINPAQSYLLELKRVAVMRLPFEDVWEMFGEGVHLKFHKLFEREIAPFLSQGATNFWIKKAHYLKDGIYYHGKLKEKLIGNSQQFKTFTNGWNGKTDKSGMGGCKLNRKGTNINYLITFSMEHDPLVCTCQEQWLNSFINAPTLEHQKELWYIFNNFLFQNFKELLTSTTNSSISLLLLANG